MEGQAENESRGGGVIRVQLDNELKNGLYSRLARASQDKTRNPRTSREEIANRYHLKVASGKVPIPDLRVEYVRENDNEIQRRDLELATDHYRPQGSRRRLAPGFKFTPSKGRLTGCGVYVRALAVVGAFLLSASSGSLLRVLSRNSAHHD